MGETGPKGRGSSTKQWSDIFSEPREVADISIIEESETTGNERGLVDTFLQEDSSPVPSKQIERARAFFARGQSEARDGLPLARAWVYKHRQTDDGVSVEVSHMTAPQLVEALRQRVCT